MTNYKKSTETDLIINYFRFIPTRQKLGLVKIVVASLYEITNTWTGFQNNMQKSKSILQKGLFPSQLWNKFVKNYLRDQ